MSNQVTKDPIKEIADIMLADKDFKNSILDTLKKITADGKIDQSDIPFVVGVILENYNKFEKFRVTNEQIGEVLGYLCSELLHREKLIPEDQIDNIEKLISNSIYLVLSNPIVETVKQNCVSCFGNLFKKK